MWTALIALGVAIGAVGYAVKDKLYPTAAKVRNGDAVFVNVTAVSLGAGATEEQKAGMKKFLDGFMASQIKITDVQVNREKMSGTGSIVGIPAPIVFPLSAVTKIERGGKQFT